MSWSLAAATLLLLLALWPGNRFLAAGRARHLRTALALAAAPMLLLLAFWGAAERSEFGDVRLALQQIALGRAAVERAGLSVGGTTANDLVAPGLPDGALRVVGTDDGGLAVVGRLIPASAGEPGALIGLGKGGGAPYLGARPFAPGDRLCLEACAGPGAAWLQLAPGGERLAIVGRPQAELPRLWTRKVLGLSRLRHWAPQARIYPLRDFGRPQLPGAAVGADPCVRRWLCDVAGRPVRSFLFRPGEGDGALWVAMADPGAELVHGGGAVAATREAVIAAWPADSASGQVKARLWKVAAVPPQDDPADEHAPPSRLRDGRDVIVELADGQVSARLDPPPAIGLAGADLGRVADAASGEARLAVSGPAAPDGGAPARDVVAAPGVGGAAAAAASFTLALPQGAGATGFRLTEGDSTRAARFGADFSVGRIARGEGAVLGLRLDRLSYPTLMLVVAGAWAAVLGISLRRRLVETPLALMLLAVLQLLLALRFLAALEAAHLDYRLDWDALTRAAILAYVSAPALLAVLWAGFLRPPAQDEPAFAAPLAITLFLGAVVAVCPPRDLTTAALPALALAVGAAASLRPVIAAIPAVRRARLAWRWPSARLDPAVAPLIAIALLLAARLGLALLGFKERVFGVPISLIYLPVALAGFAALLRAAARPPRLGRALLFSGLLALVFLAPAAVNDWGFFIFGLGLALYAAPLALAALRRRRPLAALAWAAPTAGIVLALAGLILAPLAGSARWQGQLEHARALSDDQARTLLKHLTLTDTNQLRIWAQTDPGRVDAAGTDLAEQHRAWSGALADYASSAWGWGFMSPSALPDTLRADQLDDNASAVHLMAPFGRIGTALLLVLLFAQARWAAEAPTAPSLARTLGLVSLWTVFAAAAYMVLANLQLIPFTGKNVYLLASASTGDLWEGTVLIALALFGLARTPRAAPT